VGGGDSCLETSIFRGRVCNRVEDLVNRGQPDRKSPGRCGKAGGNTIVSPQVLRKERERNKKKGRLQICLLLVNQVNNRGGGEDSVFGEKEQGQDSKTTKEGKAEKGTNCGQTRRGNPEKG